MRRVLVAALLLMLGVFIVSAQDTPQPQPPSPAPQPPSSSPEPPAPEGEDKDSVVEAFDAHGVVKPFCRIDYADLNESSGLEHWQGAWWSHNDSGDGAYLYRSDDLTFKNARRYAVPGAVAQDWEEVTTLGDDLVVCDIGDNARKRDDLMLYRVTWDADNAKLALKAKYSVSYPDGKHDAEAAVDIGGVLHIVSKHRGEGYTGVYRFADLKEGEKNVGELVGKLEIDERVMITAGDYDPESKKLLLLSYTRLFVYGDKLDGKPERSVLIYAQQCESLCIHNGAAVYGNEQQEVWRINKFIGSKYEFLLPPWVETELPMQDEDVEPAGAGLGWADGSYSFKLQNMREGEFLRWKVCGAYLQIAGRFEYDSFSSSSARGNRLGSSLLLMIGSEWTDFLAGSEKHIWLGDNGETGVDGWLLDAKKFELSNIAGLKSAGSVKNKAWTFEYAIPLTEIFGEGKLPEGFLVNVWGYNLHGEDEPHLRGSSVLTLSNPYMWAGATVKQPKKEEEKPKED